MDCSRPGLPVPHHFLKFAQVHVHCISDANQLSQPLMPSSPSALNLSQHQGLFQWVSCSHQLTRVLALQHQSFPRSIQSWFPLRLIGLISLQSKGLSGVFSTPQFEGINSSALSLFTVQLSHHYITIGKTTALTIWTFVGRVMSLLFTTLSGFVIAFLPRSNHLLISWLRSPPTVILESMKRKSVTTSTFSPSICLEVMGPDVMILVF